MAMLIQLKYFEFNLFPDLFFKTDSQNLKLLQLQQTLLLEKIKEKKIMEEKEHHLPEKGLESTADYW